MAKELGFHHVFHPGRGSKRTLLVLHGTGGDENSLVPLASSIDPDAAILSPRGNVREGEMPRFFRRLSEGVFDLADLRLRTHELADFVTEASKVYGLDLESIVAVGYSNGANIAASLHLLHPGLVKASVLLRAMVPFVPETPPDLHGTRIFLSEGSFDPIVPLQNAKRLAGMLQGYGAEVHVRWNDLGHELGRLEIAAARDWLA